MLYREIAAVYSGNCAKPINTQCGQNKCLSMATARYLYLALDIVAITNDPSTLDVRCHVYVMNAVGLSVTLALTTSLHGAKT